MGHKATCASHFGRVIAQPDTPLYDPLGGGNPLAREQRRLAAIVAADVVGYSRLMGRDESGTLAALKALRREVVDPPIAAHGGRIVKTTGDGLLLEFPSVVDAVHCVIEMQTGMAAKVADVPEDRRISFRVGVNIGDIIIDGDDIFGDGVNIAARLQEIAPSGGVVVSGRVHDDVQDRLDAVFADVGIHELKNIARPVHVWRWTPDGVAPAAVSVQATLALPDKPSIAVLPFTNMSGDPDQEYFVDGLVEDIITALSRFKSLFVIARNSSFAYKGAAVDIKQVGRELGVRYVLEGSVRRAVNQVRITGQLIQVNSGAHIWADRYDGDLAGIFELQDKVALDVVGAITSKLEAAEMDRARRKPTAALDAYDYHLRGMASLYRLTRESTSEALDLFYKAINLDPDFALPHGWATQCYMWRSGFGWLTDRNRETAEAVRLAQRAVELDSDDALPLSSAALTFIILGVDFNYGRALLERALLLNPNLMLAWLGMGWVNIWNGEAEPAIEAFTRAMRLSPLDPFNFGMLQGMAFGHFLAGRYNEASTWAEKSLRVHQERPSGLRLMAASYALAGRMEEARKAMTRARHLDPALRVSKVRDWIHFRRPEDLARYEGALRIAGLPE
jgi:TolB-like protein/class 3 adenylate cyclase